RLSRSTTPFALLAGPASLEVQALHTKAVQEDLKLTPAQVARVAALVNAFQEAASRRGATPQDPRRRPEEATETLLKGIASTLDAGQNTRLRQILLQHQRKAGLGTLLLQPAVVAALKLSDRQRDRITTIRTDATEVRSMMLREYGRARDDEDL